MGALLRFWRALPRTFAGLLFAIELLLLYAGRDTVTHSSAAIRTFKAFFGETATGIVVVATLVGAGAIGAELARALLLPIRSSLGALLRKVRVSRFPRLGVLLSTFSSSPTALAGSLFSSHTAFLNDFYNGYSRGMALTPELLEAVKANWERQFEMLTSVIGNLARGPVEMWRVAYFAQVSQEQALADYEETLVESVQIVWLVVMTGVFVISRLGGNIWFALAAAIAIAVLFLPTYLRRKLTFAWYIVHLHSHSFLFAEGADVADREAE
jgi:hypothetical protein